uniref:Secreted protein n=1 Tax=Macrostomum lignano TaxID=282301 RepID=A0A1I8FPE4_9PLAT
QTETGLRSVLCRCCRSLTTAVRPRVELLQVKKTKKATRCPSKEPAKAAPLVLLLLLSLQLAQAAPSRPRDAPIAMRLPRPTWRCQRLLPSRRAGEFQFQHGPLCHRFNGALLPLRLLLWLLLLGQPAPQLAFRAEPAAGMARAMSLRDSGVAMAT